MNNKSKAAALILAVVLCFSLCGCAPKLQEGEVYEKNFTPAHTTFMMIPCSIYNGKTTNIVMIPVWRHYPDQYEICIKAVSVAMTIFVWAWMECFHPSQEDVNRLSDEVRNIRESVNSRNLNIWEVKDAIKDEFGWEI